eukprot:1159191-Pelagomonas_calceolata.AAC.4
MHRVICMRAGLCEKTRACATCRGTHAACAAAAAAAPPAYAKQDMSIYKCAAHMGAYDVQPSFCFL